MDNHGFIIYVFDKGFYKDNESLENLEIDKKGDVKLPVKSDSYIIAGNKVYIFSEFSKGAFFIKDTRSANRVFKWFEKYGAILMHQSDSNISVREVMMPNSDYKT